MTEETKANVAGVTGGAVGAAGSIGTVAAAGTVSGLGATGITSGLCAIGSALGGGMATGLVVATGAPLVVAGGVYGLYKWLRD